MPKQKSKTSQRPELGPVRQFILRHSEPLWRDDLLVRVICFLVGGLAAGAIGVPMLVSGATTQDLEGTGFVLRLFYFAVAALFTGYGGLMLLRCVVSARSWPARILDRFLPDGVGLEGGLLVLLIFLPAVLLTLGLRWLGVKGQHIDWDRVGPK